MIVVVIVSRRGDRDEGGDKRGQKEYDEVKI
jgi:hypothetical protein